MGSVGKQIPYFEFLDGIKGKSLYDLKQKHHIVIYKTDNDTLEKFEEDFEKANIKLIDFIQLISTDFLKKLGLDNKEEFIIIVDKFGVIQYIGDKILPFKEIMNIIFFAENEGCCSL
ncbi:MAG: hypothetical protein DSY53_03830 [Persephonella sp.]|nr:MAG: hypothetical protein DSY53_03830 [Persephonella sp.]